MDVTTLGHLLQEGGVSMELQSLIITTRSTWVVKGEDKLSYTTLVRLVECCREYHWSCDVVPFAQGIPVDSTIRTLTARFLKPVKVGSTVAVAYKITAVHERSYLLDIEIRDISNDMICAHFSLDAVFFDAGNNSSMTPPASVLANLRATTADISQNL